jgi:allantoinase
MRAWGGIASLQFALPLVWSEACARGFGPEAVARWMSRAPAAQVGLSGRKGAVSVGCDADLVVWDPDEPVRVEVASTFHRHPVSPYEGRELRGRVCRTILRGRVVYDEGRFVNEAEGRMIAASF